MFYELHTAVNGYRETAVNLAIFKKLCRDFFQFVTVIFVQPYQYLI